MREGITPVRKSHVRTRHDHLPLPGGQTVGQVDDLSRAVRALNVPGVDASMGRPDVAAAYARHLARIGKEAADAAIAAWLKQHEV